MAQLQPYCAIEGNDDGLPVVFVHGMGVDHRSLMMLDEAFDSPHISGPARLWAYAGIARECLRAAGNGGLAANGH